MTGRRRTWAALALVLLMIVLALVLFSCVRGRSPAGQSWTPPPVTGSPIVATARPALLPTLAVVQGTAEPGALPPIATAPPPQLTTSPGNWVRITEGDVLRAVESGLTAQQGATIEGAGVTFGQGRMRLSAVRLSYGPLNVQNLVLIGRLVATDGVLQLETESIAPRSLVTSLIPPLANQALARYTAQWYVEEARTVDGRLELRIR